MANHDRRRLHPGPLGESEADDHALDARSPHEPLVGDTKASGWQKAALVLALFTAVVLMALALRAR